MKRCATCNVETDDFRFYVDKENFNPPRTLDVCPSCKDKLLEDEAMQKRQAEADGLPADAVAAAITDLIEEDQFGEVWVGHEYNIRTESFLSAGVLTRDAGFVLKIGNHQYQITVVQSR